MDDKTNRDPAAKPDQPHGPSDIVGSQLATHAGEPLGTIRDVAIDTASGRVAYVIVGEGGFLGFGERLHAVPWDLLRYDPVLRRYEAPLDDQQLQLAQAHAAQELGADRELDDPAGSRTYLAPGGLMPWV